MLVGSIYSSAEVYMLTDTSPGFSDTWAYVDRRIDDMIQAFKLEEEVGGVLNSVALGAISLLTPFKRQ